MELAGRHVVVTGAASGIGRALASAFAAQDASQVVVADLDFDGAQAVADAIGGRAVRVDVSRPEEISRLVGEAVEAGGPIDLFFSNAGIGGPLGGPEGSDQEWELTWKVNVMSHVWAARELLPQMVQRGEGYLASTASAAGLLTQVSAMAYSATKHAAVAVAEWIAINYGEKGIGVSCLCPQGVRTPMVELALEKDPVGSVALLSEGLMEPDQVAEVVVQGIREERFLILPHEAVADYMALRGAQHDRWLAGMRKIMRTAQTQQGA